MLFHVGLLIFASLRQLNWLVPASPRGVGWFILTEHLLGSSAFLTVLLLTVDICLGKREPSAPGQFQGLPEAFELFTFLA